MSASVKGQIWFTRGYVCETILSRNTANTRTSQLYERTTYLKLCVLATNPWSYIVPMSYNCQLLVRSKTGLKFVLILFQDSWFYVTFCDFISVL